MSGAHPASEPVVLRLFHGSRTRGIEALRASKGGEYGPGVYLTESPDTARFYARTVASGPDAPVIYVVDARIEKPFVTTKAVWLQATASRSRGTVQRALMKRGYDAIVSTELSGAGSQIIVFDPSKVTIVSHSPGRSSGASGRAEAFAAGFFARHPNLRRFAPRRVVDAAPSGGGLLRVGSGHPEARQSGEDVALYPKFWLLPADVQDFVFAHELGHLLQSKAAPGTVFLDLASKHGIDPWDVSALPFGQFNMDEAFADAFASKHLDGDVLRRYPAWARLVDSVISNAGRTAGRSGEPSAMPRPHALVLLESNGERSRAERAWTATCRCGWTESASTKAEALREHRWHLRDLAPAGPRFSV